MRRRMVIALVVSNVVVAVCLLATASCSRDTEWKWSRQGILRAEQAGILVPAPAGSAAAHDVNRRPSTLDGDQVLQLQKLLHPHQHAGVFSLTWMTMLGSAGPPIVLLNLVAVVAIWGLKQRRDGS